MFHHNHSSCFTCINHLAVNLTVCILNISLYLHQFFWATQPMSPCADEKLWLLSAGCLKLYRQCIVSPCWVTNWNSWWDGKSGCHLFKGFTFTYRNASPLKTHVSVEHSTQAETSYSGGGLTQNPWWGKAHGLSSVSTFLIRWLTPQRSGWSG